MKEVIKKYPAKLGNVTVERFVENGEIEFRVKHSNENIGTYWSKSKQKAIAHAQFLAGKY